MIISNDKFLTKSESNFFKNLILFDSGISWNLDMATAYTQKPMPGDALDSFQFSYVIDGQNSVSDISMEIFNRFMEDAGLEYSEIIRAKINLLTKSSYDGPHTPHVDMIEEHNVFIYYINNSDGDTFIFDKAFYDLETPVPSLEELRVAKTISPKQGRGVVFNGLQYHASSSPTVSDMRLVLNIVYR